MQEEALNYVPQNYIQYKKLFFHSGDMLHYPVPHTDFK